jgi:hypothetical protein
MTLRQSVKSGIPRGNWSTTQPTTSQPKQKASSAGFDNDYLDYHDVAFFLSHITPTHKKEDNNNIVQSIVIKISIYLFEKRITFSVLFALLAWQQGLGVLKPRIILICEDCLLGSSCW